MKESELTREQTLAISKRIRVATTAIRKSLDEARQVPFMLRVDLCEDLADTIASRVKDMKKFAKRQ